VASFLLVEAASFHLEGEVSWTRWCSNTSWRRRWKFSWSIHVRGRWNMSRFHTWRRRVYCQMHQVEEGVEVYFLLKLSIITHTFLLKI